MLNSSSLVTAERILGNSPRPEVLDPLINDLGMYAYFFGGPNLFTGCGR